MPHMTASGTLWRHAVLHVRGDWLHGDPRGFRSRDHRIHSTGDYQNPPPAEEHAGLRDWHRGRSETARELAADLQLAVLQAFLEKLKQLRHPIDALSVGQRHVHLLALLPTDVAMTKREVGKLKQYASHKVRARLPGSLWAEGGAFKPCWDVEHRANAKGYILNHLSEGAVVWCSVHGVRSPRAGSSPNASGSSPSAQTPACSDPLRLREIEKRLDSTEQAGV